MNAKEINGYCTSILLITLLIISCYSCTNNPEKIWSVNSINELYKAAPNDVQSRWVSPENPTGEKGKGGLTNKGAKGNAFFIVQPGTKQVLFDVKGAGIINRMWLSGTIPVNQVQRRAVRIDMFWDGAKKPAVSAPVGDFFGIGLGLAAKFDNALFSSPEARSFNFTIPMPFRKSAYIMITNESSEEVWIWYDINYLQVNQLPEDALYFHAFWHRELKTELGKDFEILPKVEGNGRYIGTNIGVIGDSLYRGTWFGEGEVKMYLDGDNENPSLVGTGTEDFIGSGWGQGEYASRNFGSLKSDNKNDLYAFYRYHILDPIYFHQDCKVTIQQMGNSNKNDILKMNAKGAKIVPVWLLGKEGKATVQRRLLDEANPPKPEDENFPVTSTNFYRSDDVSATAYFYLDKPESNLPELAPVGIRLKDLEERVFKMVNMKK
ncbi:MAG: glycoside hydrolase family 172 protein [Mariniphaga sp.]